MHSEAPGDNATSANRIVQKENNFFRGMAAIPIVCGIITKLMADHYDYKL